VVLSTWYYPPAPALSSLAPFEERQHFVTIGNFRHAPNMDQVSDHPKP
jgi:hypothetical protein